MKIQNLYFVFWCLQTESTKLLSTDDSISLKWLRRTHERIEEQTTNVDFDKNEE